MKPLIQLECREKSGRQIRSVRMLKKTPRNVLQLVDRLSTVRNFLPQERQFDFLLDKKTLIFMVDDVGVLVAAEVVADNAAHVHMTFWDGRLRGRERLVQLTAMWLRETCRLKYLWTAIPKELRVVRSFCERAGFKEVGQAQGQVVFQLGGD
jgi:hypothetical protein